jgi:hypothetical protein
MKRRFTVFIVSMVLVLSCISAGCITNANNKNKEPPKVYVTPCNVASKGMQIRITGSSLDALIIKPELEAVFVDNFKSPAGANMRLTYELDCYWGNKVGERRDYYYCAGKYKAPELDETQTITRFLWKDFKIGFSVEEHNVGKWVDTAGKVHDEGSVYYLMTRTVDGTCYIATN